LPTLPSSTGERHLKVETDLSGDGPRCDIVRAAEGGEKVIKRILVGDVDSRQLQADFVFVAVEQKAIRRCLAETGLGRKVHTETNSTFGRITVALGEAERAATQTVHVAESVAFEC
jgi:hypothetical protein